jgi:hypothetical protein
VHDKCIKAAFKDVASAYTYEKASTFCFSTNVQILNYASSCASVDILKDINTLYVVATGMCAAKKAATGKGTRSSKSKSKVAETEDDELVDDADEEIEI